MTPQLRILHGGIQHMLLPSEDALFTYSTRHIPPSGGESVPPCHHEENPRPARPTWGALDQVPVRYPPLAAPSRVCEAFAH